MRLRQLWIELQSFTDRAMRFCPRGCKCDLTQIVLADTYSGDFRPGAGKGRIKRNRRLQVFISVSVVVRGSALE